MDSASKRLLDAGNALARSIGHHPQCPKVSRAVPCICDAAAQQAGALDDWLHLVKELKDAEAKQS